MRVPVLATALFIAALSLGAVSACAAPASEPMANIPMPAPPSDSAGLMDLARRFVARIGPKLDAANASMGLAPAKVTAILPEGESLFFSVMLPHDVAAENVVSAEVHGQQLLVSLSDFATALELPIAVDGASGTASGWYIREANGFDLDLKAGTVKTAAGLFTPSAQVAATDTDILVPVAELAKWFDFTVTPHIDALQFDVVAKEPLPLEARQTRAGRNTLAKQQPYATLPLYEEDKPKDIAFPFVDVSTTSTFAKDGQNGDTAHDSYASVTTHGDLAGGLLLTQSNFTGDDLLTSLRATYRKDSPQADLLGPLKAHSYALGDVTPPLLPLTRRTNLGTGARITNIDPARVYLNPSTGITGTTTPGWDVELYRGALLIDRQTVGNDGVYRFDRVDLFRSRNEFKLVFYGPQGQRREEAVSVPVDPGRLADAGTVYDVAVTADGMQLYRADDTEGGIAGEDEGAPRLTALIEHAIGDNSAAQLGLEAGSNGGDTTTTVHAGVSAAFGPVLGNVNGAIQQDGESAIELAGTADLGAHQIRNDLILASPRFDVNEGAVERAMVENDLIARGPFPIPVGRNTQYTVQMNYQELADNLDRTRSTVGLDWSWGRVLFNQNLRYTKTTDLEDELDSITVMRAALGRTHIDLDIDYGISPEAQLDEVALEIQRDLNEKLDVELDVAHLAESGLNSGTLRANWRSGHGIISPSLTYDSDGNAAAMINTTFGIARDAQTKSFNVTDEQAGTNGSVGVLVYVDTNGNNIRDDGEDPVEKATIIMAQNGGSAVTDKSGYAFFNRLQNFRRTDAVLDRESLADPYWIPASEGVSILPREGHLTQLNYPVHMGGEIEGTVYTGQQGTDATGLRGVSLGLYNAAGKRVMETVTESDGYYLLAPVPPGDYALVVEDNKVQRARWQRPQPKPVHIGYDGTQLFATNLYLTPGTDASVKILDGVAQVESDDPGLNAKTLDDKTVVINLGEFHSRVLMGVMWFKVRQMLPDQVAGLSPLVNPSDSYAAAKTGEHTLRISNAALTYDDANRRCRAIAAQGLSCTVEVLPGGLNLASK